ncbi:HD domain-containing protein [Aetokthonos hydrillicola Thurmond2011]|jgi:(p)ppGpp synthase/HD superfamily hydrolase|uniref:HD domain-containing protein n=1 Tax=Aetokthonos hydrillicola Thurmond2011 TaxID=2712845 RepID=A0AAP5MAQ1_9CYAN|nr:HD domain-containing protein [Aetokthonos hydrillicola]MBO3463297.1 bifunctional (p)ppGpp synthetase/guanosine-3',5'-bis(diphosphate) 3'-pyrophosphohydrolase [Aetokthonos hydrillicola CCALA 1050]MBW4591242.1 HD domain-containing protein [Aetokthonos hydrillicola CCALA 1050]MDR9897077.1 HD domain-containing protein [Aetokthonos hydrillicola Thurmond2011]
MRKSQLTAKFEEALVYATRLHAHQTRKISGVPYISHLLSVAALVLEAGGTEEEAIAGLLHDGVEDQGGKSTREEIRQLFGETVVAIVDGCTEYDTNPKPPWLERKKRYLENISHASPSIRRVSLADKLHNARSLLADFRQNGSSIWQEFKAGKEGTLWFYQQLQQVYSATGSDFLTQEFLRVVQQLCQET